MKLDDDATILICALTAGNSPALQVPGSIESICQDCGKSVYVAPSGQRLAGARRVCISCGLKRIWNDEAPGFGVPPGQAEELGSYWNEVKHE